MSLEKELGFDLYGRYALIRDVISSTRKGKKKFKILDVGGRGNMLLKFMPDDDVYYLDPNIDADDKNFIKADGCDMPLENESYDWVVSADVLEHIPEDRRDDFFEEQFRVAKCGVIVVAPFYSKLIAQAEINVNNCFKELFGIDHPWLIEHINNGLPPIDSIKEFAESKNIVPQFFYNNEIYLWEVCQNFLLHADKNKSLDVAKLTEIYNQNYLSEIYQEESYRTVVVLQKQAKSAINIKNANKSIDPSLFKQNVLNYINSEYVRNINERQHHIEELEARPMVIEPQETQKFAQLYVSADGAFSEEASMNINIGVGPQYLCYDVSAFENPSIFRFDPANVECGITIDNVELEYQDGVEYVMVNSSNAIFVDHNTFYFNSSDPNVFLNSDANRKLNKVIFRCNYHDFEKTSFLTLINILNSKTKNNFIDINDLNQVKKDLVDEFFLHTAKNSNINRFKRIENSLKNLYQLSNSRKTELDNLIIETSNKQNSLYHEISNKHIALYNEKFDHIALLNNELHTKLVEIESTTVANNSTILDCRKSINEEINSLSILLQTIKEKNELFEENVNAKFVNISTKIENNLNDRFKEIGQNIIELREFLIAFKTDVISEADDKSRHLLNSITSSIEDSQNNFVKRYDLLKESLNNNGKNILDSLKDISVDLKKELDVIEKDIEKSVNANNTSKKELLSEISSFRDKFTNVAELQKKNDLKLESILEKEFVDNKIKQDEIVNKLEIVNSLNTKIFDESTLNFGDNQTKQVLILDRLKDIIDFNQELFVKKEREWKLDIEGKNKEVDLISKELESLHEYINSGILRKVVMRKKLKK